MAAIAGRQLAIRYYRFVHYYTAGNRCHFVLLDKDESCPTADLSNTGRPNGPACSTGELLNMPLVNPMSYLFRFSIHIPTAKTERPPSAVVNASGCSGCPRAALSTVGFTNSHRSCPRTTSDTKSRPSLQQSTICNDDNIVHYEEVYSPQKQKHKCEKTPKIRIQYGKTIQCKIQYNMERQQYGKTILQ